MATVAKSIIYAWPNVTQSVAQSGPGIFTTASFGGKALYFPETSSRVFKSVFSEISFHDNSTVATGISQIAVELRISGSTNSSKFTSNVSVAGVTTGENISFVGGPFDFTSFFNAFVPSNSSSINLEAFSYYENIAGVAMQNASFKLYCTYEHDDIDTTYIKTAIIPLESPITGLSTTAPGIIGNQQIPRLVTSASFPGFLPESDINIRDYFIEIEGNESSGGSSTDIQLTGSITSSFSNVRTTFFPIERALSSDTYDRLIWSVPTSSLPNVSQSHNFGLRTNITSDAAFRHVPVNLYVTYEYNKTTTTQVNNTVLLGWNLNAPLNLGGGGFVGTANVAQNTFIIPESNPILQQSALRMQWADTSTVGTLAVRVDSQNSSTAYTDGGGAICGMKSLQHRFDISASNQHASESGVVLRKGVNYINSSFFVTSTTIPATNTNGYYIINYKSDIHPTKGVDGCTRYYYFSNRQWPISDQSSPTYYTSSFNYNLSNSSSLYVVDTIHNYISFERNATTLLNLGIQYTGSESTTLSNIYPKETIWRGTILSDPEAGSFITTLSTSNFFKNYITSPKSNLMDPFTTRNYVNLYDSPTTTVQYTLFASTNILVAHSYTFDFTGSIYNYNGDGSGIPVTIYQSGSVEAILNLTSTVGGKFSGTWFDDSTPIFASIDFGDKFGKSKLNIVTGSFDVYLIPFEYGYSNM